MRIKSIASAWLPPILLMIIIFALSSRQRIGVSETYTVNFIIFKSLHIIEYAILYVLLFRAYGKTLKKPVKTIALYAALTAIAFAFSDEFHQTFVPTREGAIRDVGIDGIGIFLSFLYTKSKLHILKNIL